MMTVDTGKVILYDDACPMCQAYTAGFVRWGILAPEGRIGFAHADPHDIAALDTKRARHEIPLLDRETGTVIYGLDALTFLLSGRLPLFRSAWMRQVFRQVLTPLYRYISYNRRVIAGCSSASQRPASFDCAPDFHQGWRLAHIAVCVLGGIAAMTAFGVKAVQMAEQGGIVLLAAVLLLHLLLLLAPVVVSRHCGAWERTGSMATNTLMFGLLLTLGTSMAHGLIALSIVALAAGTITTLDASRRLRHHPVVTVRSGTHHRGIPLPMTQEENDNGSHCTRCR